MKKDFRIVFMGTPDFAVYSLNSLMENGYNVVSVVTSPDKPAGRGREIKFSEVKKYAKSHNINILQPSNLKSEEFINNLKELDAKLFVVVAFRMLPEIVWKMPEKGTLNLHASLLPNYRGAAPINWAIINGESKTGVTTFFIEKEIDTGKIIQQKSVEITNDMNAGELHDILMKKGADLLIETVDSIINNNFKTFAQKDVIIENDLKSAPKIYKKDCSINWNNDVLSIYNFIRGLSPYPTAWTKIINDTDKQYTLKIFETEIINGRHDAQPGKIITDNKNYIYITADGGILNLKILQLEGKKKMKTEEFLRGFDMEKFTIGK